MGRIRTIKPSFWAHEDLSDLPEATHMLAAALLNYCDDEGYFNANPKLIRAECCPLREPSVSIPASLQSLLTISYIRLGNGSDGRRYGQVVNFTTHQRVSKPTPSKFKDIDIVWDSSATPTGTLPEPSLQEGKGRDSELEGKGREDSASLRSAAEPATPSANEVDLDFDEELDLPPNQDRRPPSPERDLLKAVFDQGIGLGMVRSQIGKMRQLCGNDDVALHSLFNRCQANVAARRCLDPVAWCFAELQPQKPNGSAPKLVDLNDAAQAAADREAAGLRVRRLMA